MIAGLDEHTLARIVELAGGPYFVTGLRGASRELRARIAAPKHCFSDTLLREASLAGDLQLCVLARQHGANDVDTMLCASACGGHLETCKLAFDWGARRCREAIKLARENNHKHIEQFIIQVYEKIPVSVPVFARDYNRVLISRGIFGMRFVS